LARRRRAVFKTIRGVEHKLCTGPGHPEGKFVPTTNFFLRGDDKTKLRPQCKHCESIHAGAEQSVPYSEIKFAVNELIFRLGKAETARRIGVRANTLWEWTNGKRKSVHRKNAKAIITALAEARANGEARHRKSIKHGAAARGREERVPVRHGEFNGPSDHLNEVKKKWIDKKPIEIRRQKWAEAKRRQVARQKERLEKVA